MQAFEITVMDVLSLQNVCFSETIFGKFQVFVLEYYAKGDYIVKHAG